jgi:flavin reductase (DIM6/NTAB) family NADH-FMN oxidoreductase RutF
MQFDMRALPKSDRYKILGSCVIPRPIAWITSMSQTGVMNAAPYSFFNMLGDDPLTVAIGLMQHGEQRWKDTAANILSTGEFVVNLVDEAHGSAMNVTCMDAPPEVSELVCAGLETVSSILVGPPRIATAPASFECRTLHAIETGPHQLVVIAEVIYGHLRDEYVIDPERLHIDTPAMGLLGRMHGAGWYSRQTDLVQMHRPTWAEWNAGRAIK